MGKSRNMRSVEEEEGKKKKDCTEKGRKDVGMGTRTLCDTQKRSLFSFILMASN